MKRRSLQRFLRKILIPFGIILMLFTACTREPEVIRTETEKTEPVSESVTETDPETEKTTETETVSESESESTEDPEAREESASENTADTESESESETESSEETETAAPKNSHEGEAVFFGHYMNADIAALNQRTLNSEGAHLYDVLSEPSFGAESVRALIEAYSFPETAYLGGEPRTDDRTWEIMENRNLSALSEENFGIRYALLTDNADVRAFPTMLPAKNELTEESFDLLQESGFSLGEGVIVLHESADGAFLFVQGSNYSGWIEREKAAFCGFSEFSEYLSAEDFIVVLKQRFMLNSQAMRLGTVLPYRERTEEGFTVLLPERSESGELIIREEMVPDDPQSVSDGFLPYSVEDLTNRSFTLTGFPYGWGDTNQYYDCSSTAGLLYQCYGIRLPRNTSWMKGFDGGGAYRISLEGLSDEEKLQEIVKHPGAVLVMNGHAMIYGGTRTDEEGNTHYIVVHANSGYYDSPAADVFHPVYATVEADLLGLYRADGTLFLSAVHTLLYYE